MRFTLCALVLSLAGTLAAVQGAETSRLVSATDMSSCGGERVCVQGVVQDVFSDERDANYIFLLILTDTGPIYAAMNTTRLADRRRPFDLVNATIQASGICLASNNGLQPRRHLGHFLRIDTREPNNGLSVVSPAPADPFCVPLADEASNLNPSRIQQSLRRKIAGRVIAVWKPANVLLKTRMGRFSRVELSATDLPPLGSFVETVGFLDTDIYRLNLTRAIWRPTDPWPTTNDAVIATSAERILTDGKGHPLVDTRMYGKPVELQGVVLAHPGNDDNGIVNIDNDGYTIAIDASSCRPVLNSVSNGSRIKVRGICLLNIGNCRPNDIFPQVKGFTLILRSPDDLTILSHAPWLNSQRLSWLLAIALILTVVVLIWNRSLSVLAERRGRQLAKEQVRRATSELKVMERTRLSVDLHDALSQTLSGIAMQLGAIKRFSITDPVRMAKHLDIASRTLKSCRDEMKNLLWDLRSQVLDEPDIEAAIRQILEPQSEGAAIRIRFAVPRTRLTDSTARTLFCIIRELVVNAIRHGNATVIRIAGSLENGQLLCSVRDDGSGFDISTAPGAREGHFGLQGVRERIEAANGSFEIESSSGLGTRVSLSIPAPNKD